MRHIIVEDIHDVHEYEQSWDLAKATQGMIDARREYVRTGNAAMGNAFKTLVNAFIGKTLQDPSRYASIVKEIDDAIADIRSVVKHQSDPRFKSRTDYGDSLRAHQPNCECRR